MTKNSIRVINTALKLGLVPSVWLVLFCACFVGCGDPTIPGLSMSERKLADSLYRDEMKVFRPKMDSICTALQDSLLPIYIDSMKKERIAEIERQLERIKKLK